MAYVIRELCTTPAFTQPLLSSSSTNSNPNPNPSKSEEELIIADISTRSSNARFIPNRYDIWYNYYPRYDDDDNDNDDDDDTIKQSNISIYAKLLSFTRRAKARDAAAEEEEGKFMSQKERQRCAKAYLAFILCSLRSRQKVNVGRSSQLESLDCAVCNIVAEVGVVGCIVSKSGGSFCFSETSDRVDLCRNLLKSCGSPSREFYHISFARLVSFGLDCIIVAWNIPGNSLGMIHIYKSGVGKQSATNSRSQQLVWHLVGQIIGQNIGSKAAAVTDIVPVCFQNGETGYRYCLLITRVGGTPEFVAIPRKICENSISTSKIPQVTITPIKLVSIVQNSPLLVNHDSFCMEVYQDRNHKDRVLLLLSGLSHTSSSCMVSAWMILSHSQDHPVSVTNIGQFGLSATACTCVISSTIVTCKQQANDLGESVDNSILLPPLQMAFSSDGKFLALLDYNGCITNFECFNMNSTSCSVQEKQTQEYFFELSPEGFTQIGWSSATELILVSLSGNIFVVDALQGKCTVSMQCRASAVFGASPTTNFAVSKDNQKYSVILMEKLSPECSVEHMIVHKNVDEAHKMVVEHDIHDDTTLKALWEVTLSTKALERNLDIAVNITEALLCRIVDDDYVVENAFSAAIDIASAMKVLLEEGIKRASTKKLHDKVASLKNRLKRLITFTWICSSKKLTFSGTRFRSMFCNVSLVDYAICCCHRKDFDLLTVLILQHGDELLPHRLTILSSIALNVDPEMYEHLLPVIPSEFFRSSCPATLNTYFFMDKASGVMTIADITSRYKDILPDNSHYSLEINFGSGAIGEDLLTVTKWFTSRALAIENSSGRIDLAHKLLEMAANRLKDTADNSGLTGWLLSLSFITGHLSRCIYDGVMQSNYSLCDWSQLGMSGFIHSLLSDHDGEKCLDIWRNYVTPILTRKPFEYALSFEIFENLILRNVEDDAFDALSEYCKFRCAAEGVCGLDVCLAFVKASTPFVIGNGIFQSIDLKVNFVIDSIYLCDFYISDECLDAMWSLYDCLPDNGDVLYDKSLIQKVSTLRKDLILANILVSYEDVRGFESFSLAMTNTDAKIVIDRIMQHVFDQLLTRSSISDWHDTIMQLLVDVAEIRTQIFPQCKMVGYAESVISRFLIAEQQFLVLKTLINLNRSEILRKIAKMLVSEYTCLVFDNYDWKSPNVVSANKCRNIFISVFPEHRSMFEKQEKMTKIAQFLEAYSYFPPLSLLRTTTPIEIMTAFLCTNPDIFEPMWKDSVLGLVHSRELITILNQGRDMSTFSLPGSPIRSLISLFGSNDLYIFGDAKMAQHALQIELYPTASALCYFLLYNVGDSHELMFDGFDIDILEIVVKIVSQENFDSFIRFQLCSLALSRIDTFCHTESFALNMTSLIKNFSHLELTMSKNTQDKVMHVSNDNTNGGFLVFQAAAMFSEGARHLVNKNEYLTGQNAQHSENTGFLVESANKVVTDNVLDVFRETIMMVTSSDIEITAIDDTIILSAARNMIVNCIDMSTSIKLVSSGFAISFVHNIQFAISLLLGIGGSKETILIVSDMISLLEEKTAESLENLSKIADNAPTYVLPDESIVKQVSSYGFSEDGARRSVAATQNENCAKALEYAMQHENDPTFNLPFIPPSRAAIKKEKGVVDQFAVHYLKFSLKFTQKKLEENLRVTLNIEQSEGNDGHQLLAYKMRIDDSWEQTGWDDDDIIFDQEIGDAEQLNKTISAPDRCKSGGSLASSVERTQSDPLSNACNMNQPLPENTQVRTDTRTDLINKIQVERTTTCTGSTSTKIPISPCAESKHMLLNDGWDDDFDLDSSSSASEIFAGSTSETVYLDASNPQSHFLTNEIQEDYRKTGDSTALRGKCLSDQEPNQRAKLLTDARSILASRKNLANKNSAQNVSLKDFSRECLLSDARTLLQKRRDMALSSKDTDPSLRNTHKFRSYNYSNREAALEASRNLLKKRLEAKNP